MSDENCNEEVIAKMTKELKEIIGTLTSSQARYLCDSYWGLQKYRVMLGNQLWADENKIDDQPAQVLKWFHNNMKRLESQMKGALVTFAKSKRVGRWAMSINGVGEVISAGLIAYIDMDIAKTPGHIYGFAGLNPESRWLGKTRIEEMMRRNDINPNGTKKLSDEDAYRIAYRVQELGGVKMKTAMNELKKYGKINGKNIYKAVSIRPWCAQLKKLCWIIGDSFNKQKSRDGDIYGKLIDERKAIEHDKNERGEFAEQAAQILEDHRNHAQAKIYQEGKLPDGHIHERAKRWAVKLFLSHWWEIAYEEHFGKKPPIGPYAIDILKHAHKIKVPNADVA